MCSFWCFNESWKRSQLFNAVAQFPGKEQASPQTGHAKVRGLVRGRFGRGSGAVRAWFGRGSGVVRAQRGSGMVRARFGRGSGAVRARSGRGPGAVRARFGRGSGAVRARFGRGSGAVRAWFGRGSGAMRFGPGSGAVRARFGRGSGVVRAWFGHGLVGLFSCYLVDGFCRNRAVKDSLKHCMIKPENHPGNKITPDIDKNCQKTFQQFWGCNLRTQRRI